jgi:hypothetical protein
MALPVCGLMALMAAPARAEEGHTYTSEAAFKASFYLIGGQYEIYVNAAPSTVAAMSGASCLFNGNFQRVWPTHDSMPLGGPVPFSLIPYRMDQTFALQPGFYALYVAPLIDCKWTFTVFATNANGAGVAPVDILTRTAAGMTITNTATVRDDVVFRAQFRTDHNVAAPVSGTLQIIDSGTVIRTAPLLVSQDAATKADELFAAVQFEPSDAAHLGILTARFVVRIGPADYSSTGKFTLTQ